MVPSGWKQKPLKDLCKMQAGKFVKANQILPEEEENTYPCFGGNGLRGYTKSFTHSGSYSLIGRQGALCGNITLAEGKFHATEHAVVTHPNSDVDTIWLFYVLIDLNLNQYATGQAQPGLSVKNLDNVYALAPESKSEQRKIAKILGTWDKAISTTERLIANSKQQKKALMQQLLTGKKRLLDDSGNPFEGEWEEVKLSHFFERVMEKNNGQSKNVVTISAQHGLIRQEEFFKKSVASETLDNYFILRKGQFAYNKSYSNGYPMGAIKRLNRYDDAVVTSLYICFELKDEQLASSCFMEQFFESGLLNQGITKVAAEGGRAHGLLNVKPADFMALSMAVPKMNEQQKIASVLSNVDKEIELLEQQLADLKQEKKALMQQLLTGKRRVKVDDEAVA